MFCWQRACDVSPTVTSTAAMNKYPRTESLPFLENRICLSSMQNIGSGRIALSRIVSIAKSVNRGAYKSR